MKNLKFWVLLLSGSIMNIIGVSWAFYWGGINNVPGFWGSAFVVYLGLVIMYVSVILRLT